MTVRLVAPLLVFTYVLLYSPCTASGQNAYLDSLHIVYKNAQGPEEELEILHQLIGAYFSFGPNEAVKLAHRFDSVAVALKDPVWLAKAKNNLGLSYMMAADYEKSMAHLIEALPLWETLQDSTYIGKVLSNIGACYQYRKEPQKSISYFKKSLPYFKATKDSVWIANCYTNLSTQYTGAEAYDSAAYYQKRAFEIHSAQNNEKGLLYTTMSLAATHYYQEDYANAIHYYQKALDGTSREKFARKRAMILSNLGQCHTRAGNFSTANTRLEQALVLSRELGAADQENQVLLNMSELAESQGDYKKALEYYEEGLAIKDSLFNAEKDANMLEMLTKYEAEKKQAENDYLLSQNQIKDLKIKNAQRQRNYSLLGLLALFIVLGVIFYAFRLKQKTNRELARKNQQILDALSEKEVLLKEIHHRVKNNLQVISSLLSLQSRRVNDKATANAIIESRNRVKAMGLIHQSLYREDNLTGVDAAAYISKLVENLFETYNVQPNQVAFEKDIQTLNVDIDTIIPFGLIINELISNALKYAFPNGRKGKIQVQLQRQAGQLFLQVKDNGVGLPDDFSSENLSSFGYKLVQVFTKKMRAILDITSDSGTTVTLTAPV